jgi:hypothetical protein
MHKIKKLINGKAEGICRLKIIPRMKRKRCSNRIAIPTDAIVIPKI